MSTRPQRQPRAPALRLIGVWGVAGFALLLTNAIVRLTPLAIEPLAEGALTGPQIALYVGWVLFSLYFEGYKAFQLQVSPRVVARAQYLSAHPTLLRGVLAPLFCMGLFHASKKRLITSWVVLTCVVMLVISVRYLSQPWRGIIDGGVVVALSWGLAFLLYYFARGLSGAAMPVPADVPHEVAAAGERRLAGTGSES